MKQYSRRIAKMVGRINTDYPALDAFIHALGSDVYLVGGYVRDSLIGKDSRDIDILVDMPAFEIECCLKKESVSYRKNHFGGFKFFLGKEIDLWSIEDNWAFKSGYVPALHQNMLHSIAQGCFYNYDSLVVNYNTLEYDLSNYIGFLRTKVLKIVIGENDYTWGNPTALANIYRALWISERTGAILSERVQDYMGSVLGEHIDASDNYLEILNSKLLEYPKYQGTVDDFDVMSFYRKYLQNGEGFLPFYDFDEPLFKQLELSFEI